MAKYTDAELEVVLFDAEDVITTSCTGVDDSCPFDVNSCDSDD